MMELELQYSNGSRHFKKEAFALPVGFCWHKGLYIEDPADDCGFCVEAVYISGDGSGIIVFEEEYSGLMEEDLVTEWTNFGWTLQVSDN